MRRQSVLSFAAASGRVGYVFLVKGKLADWRMSGLAGQTPEAARRYAERWISKLSPNVVVTEDIGHARHKGIRTKTIVSAVAKAAAAHRVLVLAVPRRRRFQNKYVEATVLAERFPALQAWLPKPRKLWDGEPREIVYFEALALALEVVDKEDGGGPQ